MEFFKVEVVAVVTNDNNYFSCCLMSKTLQYEEHIRSFKEKLYFSYNNHNKNYYIFKINF